MSQLEWCLRNVMAVRTQRKVRRSLKETTCVRSDCRAKAARGRRGLCKRCFNQFDYARSLCRNARERRRFEEEQVKAGNVLASSRGRCRKSENPYLKKVS